MLVIMEARKAVMARNFDNRVRLGAKNPITSIPRHCAHTHCDHGCVQLTRSANTVYNVYRMYTNRPTLRLTD